MRKLFPWLIAAGALVWLWHGCAPISRPPGVLVRQDPEQTILSPAGQVINLRGWKLVPLATYSITARVLSIATYSGDPADELAPIDLAVGWGPMSDTAVIEKLDISQSGRFYRWRYWGEKPPIPVRDIITHSANMHMVPEDDHVLERLKSLRTGSIVRLLGYLIEASHPRAAHPWRSSLSREDTGDGACELMYVQSVTETD